ncbi:ABC transporter permease [Neisseria wadsworthii]|uniref:ABC transporter permease n=1 Tax=Neisseria wadsworthii TaxID=607711 RepID=UPI000D3134FE|nr:ABC transporter permease [Neisseria wadsworthii]
MQQKTFTNAFIDTIRNIFSDKGVLLMLVIAPVLYGFFYPWPYSTQAARRIPAAIVDYDKSTLSQRIIRMAEASPRLRIEVLPSEHDAKMALWKGKIGGYMVLPSGLKNDVMMQRPARAGVLANGSYLLVSKEIQTGFAEVIGTISAGIQIKRLQAGGMTSEQAYAAQNPIPFVLQVQYNPTQGYGNYVVPGVAVLIVQQLLMMGSALLVGTWREQKRQYATMRAWAGRIFALSVMGWLMSLFYFGWVFYIQDYARGQNIGGMLAFTMLFAPTVATLGCLFGLWFQKRERSLQLLMFTSIPMFFLSGYAWPAESLPLPLQWLRWLIPSTSGIQASVRFNQIGTPFTEGAYLLWILLGLLAVYWLILWWYVKYSGTTFEP